ncbi:unnamed protein product, partial [Onchocerca ochengi]|uniref:Uncharacterized protein n=1 Tax=Onchocerca ochengi TaxID=42157 RepID=A0A182EZV4_ONCOC
MPSLNLMQQLAFPLRLDITSAAIAHSNTSTSPTPAAIFNIAAAANITTHTAAMLQHATTPTTAFHPYAAVQMAVAAATAATTTVATAASPSQFLQQQQQQQIIQQIQANNCNLNDTTNEYHQNDNE